VGHEYWDGLIAWMRSTQLAAGAIDESDLELFQVTDDPEEVVSIITAFANANRIEVAPA
jgi:predicted Rossmann-fold nucleotide-binding protein